MQNGKGWADRRVSMVGSPPQEIGKKRLSEEFYYIFNLTFDFPVIFGARPPEKAKKNSWTRACMAEFTLPTW